MHLTETSKVGGESEHLVECLDGPGGGGGGVGRRSREEEEGGGTIESIRVLYSRDFSWA